MTIENVSLSTRLYSRLVIGDPAPCFSSVKPLRSASSLTRTSRASRDSPMSPSRPPRQVHIMAMFPEMLKRDCERWASAKLAPVLFGVTVREYRELEAGTRSPTFEVWD